MALDSNIVGGTSYNTKPRRRAYSLLPQFVQAQAAPVTAKSGLKPPKDELTDDDFWTSIFDPAEIDDDLLLFSA